MKAHIISLRSRFLSWLDAPAVSPFERIHLRALQGVQVIIGLLFVVSEIRGVAVGFDRLSNVLLAAATAGSFFLLRGGHFRFSAILLAAAFTGAMTFAMVTTGLQEQFASVRYAVVPQLLAGLLLGSSALWIMTGFLSASMIGAAVVDFVNRTGPADPNAASYVYPAVFSILYIVLIGLIIDRIGAVLRRNFLLALDRQQQLEVAQHHLQDRHLEVEALYNKLEASYEETLRSLSAALDLRDKETQGHSSRVVGYSLLLGEALGLGEEEKQKLKWGALFHDIGKIAVPDSILHKDGPLNDDEWKVVQRHPELGHEMLNRVSFLEEALDIVLYHHERWDGRGYPRGLKGRDTPLMARIFSVVDTYDAMAHERPYSGAVSEVDIRDELKRIAGSQLDPEIVDVFLGLDPVRLQAIRLGPAGGGYEE